VTIRDDLEKVVLEARLLGAESVHHDISKVILEKLDKNELTSDEATTTLKIIDEGLARAKKRLSETLQR